MSGISDTCFFYGLVKHTETFLTEAIGSANPLLMYVVLVGITLVLVTLLFITNAANGDHSNLSSLHRPLSAPNGSKQSLHLSPKEPRWHVFLWVNILATVLFVLSVVDFASHISDYGTTQSSKYLVIWSIFLCYFFSFFGISLIYEDFAKSSVRPGPSIGNDHDSDCPRSRSNTDSLCSPSSQLTRQATSTVVYSSSGVALNTMKASLETCSDDDIAKMVLQNELKDHELESVLNPYRAVIVRRFVVEQKLESLGRRDSPMKSLPYNHSLDYCQVFGANCESVVGYVPIPLGIVGPMTVNGESIFIPMATTEGCLVASTQRGAKAISEGSGAYATVVRDGITRAPCIRMKSARDACELKLWCENSQNFTLIKDAFESTTSFGKLLSCVATIAGRNVYLRLSCFSGDAMGMNMVSKGSLAVIELLRQNFVGLELVALSGNMCTDKKAAAINWIEGRGKSVVVEATIPQSVVCITLKTTVQELVATNLHKNLIGSAMAGSIGGFNAHASNIVSAIFLATGQDLAQNVESSNCITLLEETDSGDLWISCTMPSLEVGTVGGGTSLKAQSACLRVIGCQGSGVAAGENSQQLAKVIASTVMAGELSLLSALAANTLVAAHMQHNRKH
jgi:hydroxymethylglutaryl-CoA reductase (NADPH)